MPITAEQALARAQAISPDCDTFVVRLYDGFDNEWMDVSKSVSGRRAKKIWAEKTDNGKKNTSYGDIDYYAIFPTDTTMVFSEKGKKDMERHQVNKMFGVS